MAGRVDTARELTNGTQTNDAGLRTVKPCGPGTRCWCQVSGGTSARPGL